MAGILMLAAVFVLVFTTVRGDPPNSGAPPGSAKKPIKVQEDPMEQAKIDRITSWPTRAARRRG